MDTNPNAPISPLVHLGGTSRAALQREYGAAFSALVSAIATVDGVEPNSRDYPHGGFAVAVAEHTARVVRLAAVRDEIAAILDSIEAPL